MKTFPPAVLTAPCKVNLVLRITGRREDGYHELETLFLPLPEPHDVLRVTPGEPDRGLLLDCPGVDVPPERNLVHRACTAFAAATGIAPDVRVLVEKHIPSGAGLGGGSSDAAAMLAYLNEHAGAAALTPERLAETALGLGADVPFFLLGRPALAHGVGERLQPVEVDLSGLHLLLLCPSEHVDTAWAYREWDARRLGKPHGAGLPQVLTGPGEMDTGSLCPWPVCLENDFEAAVFPAFPTLRRYKEELLRLGAAGAVMSGSGASIVAAFRDLSTANAAARALAGTGEEKAPGAFIHSP